MYNLRKAKTLLRIIFHRQQRSHYPPELWVPELNLTTRHSFDFDRRRFNILYFATAHKCVLRNYPYDLTSDAKRGTFSVNTLKCVSAQCWLSEANSLCYCWLTYQRTSKESPDSPDKFGKRSLFRIRASLLNLANSRRQMRQIKRWKVGSRYEYLSS